MENEKMILRLKQKLNDVDLQFEAEARRRGFDPAQAENMALPASLARLFTERETIKTELAELTSYQWKETNGMATEVERIQDQLRRAFSGEAWHGPSLLELLADVDAVKAASRPIPGAHNIWELVLHIAAWDKAVAQRLGGDRGAVAAAENFPVVADPSEAAWQKAIETLQENHRQLLKAMSVVADGRLDEPVVEGMSSAYVHMHGAVQHDLYHAGQIALLKKA